MSIFRIISGKSNEDIDEEFESYEEAQDYIDELESEEREINTPLDFLDDDMINYDIEEDED